MKTLVILVGPPGSGKTTYCDQNLKGYTRISQDDQGKSGHVDVFNKALERGDEFIVVDRMNQDRSQRSRYIYPASTQGYHIKIVWLNADRSVCIKRCKERKGHPTLANDDTKSIECAIDFFFNYFKMPSKREANEIVVIGSSFFVPVKDLTEEIGSRRHIIVGDIHGCLDELQELLAQLSFDEKEDVLICVGDLVDRGPKVRETLEYVMSLPRFYCARGNHDDKCVRYFQGTKVKITHGLTTTIESYGGKMPIETIDFLRKLPFILKTPSGYVVHAGFNPEMTPEEQGRADCIYMRHFGGSSYFDEKGGRLWYKLWPQDAPRVFFGHIPDPAGYETHNIVSLDGGCVFGHYLKAFDSKDGVVHYVNAKKQYSVSEYHKAAGTSNEALREREEYLVAGLLRSDRSDDDKLAIYTYTDQCVYDRAWDDITRNSRGHIYNLETGERVACAMPKFFNLGENEEYSIEKLPWGDGYEVYEKVDGWLGVLYRQDGKFKVASRGSFHSEGAQWATNFVQTVDLSFIPDEATICFEIINPQQKIILDYKGLETLMVLCAYDRHTGEEYPRVLVEEWAARAKLPIVKKFELTIHDCLRLQKEAKEQEGFVIRFKDGRRVKVKMEWYCQIAKIMSSMSPISMWESMRDGIVLQEYLVKIPEELRPMAEGYRDTLEAQYKKVMEKLSLGASPLVERFGKDKRAMAFFMEEQKVDTEVRKVAFALASGKATSLDRMVMERIYPKNNEFLAI